MFLCTRWSLVLAVCAPMCWASGAHAATGRTAQLGGREIQISNSVFHRSPVKNGLNAGNIASCEVTQAPAALATPDPVLDASGTEIKVEVSFIVGTDGRVHSPVILASQGAVADTDILKVVRSWRYRPATCNAAPTESEAKVEFSNR